VGVLDTGVVTQHPDLSDAIVAQHCFTQLDCPPSRAAEGTSAEDDHGHGSNVAGIIASNGKVASAGFAPDVELVAVKINDSNNSGQVSDWVAGLDWVYENLATLKVKVINMSFGTNATYATEAQCDSEEAAMAAAIKNLVDAGVTLFAATGNSGYTDRLPSPACITGVIAVAATYDSDAGPQPSAGGNYMWQYGMGYANCSDQTTSLDKITCFSNTHPRVDLVAPGAPIISDGLNNGTSTYRGTSQASPAAAGVAALLLQCNPALTPAEVKKYLTTTGVKLTDPKNNLSFPSVRALKAVEAACYAGNSGASGAGAGGSSPTSGNTAGTSGKKTSAAGSGGSIKTGAGGQTGTNSAGGTVGVGGASVGVGGQPITTTVSTNAQPVTAGGAAGAVVPIVGSGTGMGASDGCGCSVLGSGRSPVPVSLAFLIFSIRVGRRLRRRRTG
jgi:subtilisin family serine protease